MRQLEGGRYGQLGDSTYRRRRRRRGCLHVRTYVEDVGEGQRRQGDVVVSHRDGDGVLRQLKAKSIDKNSQYIALLRQVKSRPSSI